MFVLIGQSGPLAQQEIVVQDGMVFGRSPECKQAVMDANASRRHMRLEVQGEKLIVHDLGSFNGTFVNDQRFQSSSLEAKVGDVIRIGESRFLVTWRGVGVQKPAPTPRPTTPTAPKPPPPKPPAPRPLGSLGHTLFGFSDLASEAAIDEKRMVQISTAEVGQGADAAQLQKRLKAVLHMSEVLGTLRSTEEIFERLLESLFEVFPQAQRGFLLLGKELDELRPVAARDRQKRQGNIEISRSIVGRALKQRAGVLYSDNAADGFKAGASIFLLEIRSAMVVPLVVKDEILGVLSVDTDNPIKTFTADDLAVASAAASQASVALKNALLNERIERDALVRQNLCRFLPGPLAAQAIEGKLDLKLGGAKSKVTVFFSDIVGFTTMSETLPPEEVVAILNAYFDIMVAKISDHHGAIDKYLGDAIMAFWGIPQEPPGGAANHACFAALEMQTSLWTFNYELITQGKRPLMHGIGINSGDAVAGNLGSSRRAEYTVIGDNVNLAQRLESRAARNQVLIAESTYRETKGAALGVLLPPAKVKGKQELVKILSLRGIAQDENHALLHIPLRAQESTGEIPVLASALTRRGQSGALEITLIHPEGHEIGAPLRPDLPEMPDLPPFTVKVHESKPVAEGENGQRRYTESRVTPLSWEERLAEMLVQRRPVQGALGLDQINRH